MHRIKDIKRYTRISENTRIDNCGFGNNLRLSTDTRGKEQVSSRSNRSQPRLSNRDLAVWNPIFTLEELKHDNGSKAQRKRKKPSTAEKGSPALFRHKEHSGDNSGSGGVSDFVKVRNRDSGHRNANLLEDGEIRDLVLRGRLWYDETENSVTLQGNWDHGEFRLSRNLDPKEDPSQLFSGGNGSTVHRFSGHFSHPSNVRIANLAIGKPHSKTKMVRTLYIKQQSVEICFSRLGEQGDLRVHGHGANTIGRFRLHGMAHKSTVSEHTYLCTMAKEYDRTSNAPKPKAVPVKRGYKITPIHHKSPPSIAQVTKTAMRSESRQEDSQQYKDSSKELFAHRKRCQDDTDVAVTPTMEIEKNFTRKKEPEKNLLVEYQRPTLSRTDAFKRDLMLLGHASFCKQGRRCKVNPSCVQLNSLWKHISICKQTDCEICKSSNYARNKSLLEHFRNCTNPYCHCARTRKQFAPPEQWGERKVRFQFQQLLLQDCKDVCRPASVATERTVKSATASTRLWNRYSDH